MAHNIKAGILKQWHLEQLETLTKDGSVTLLDTRTPMEYKQGHIEVVWNIPVDIAFMRR